MLLKNSIFNIMVLAFLIISLIFSCLFSDKISPVSGEKELEIFLSFNDSFESVNSKSKMIKNGSVELIKGYRGKGVKLAGEKAQLTYSEIEIDLAKGTLLFWFKPEWDNKTAGKFSFFSAQNFIDLYRTCIKNETVQFRVKGKDSAWPVNKFITVNFSKDKWYQIALTWDNEKGMTLYIDGEKKAFQPGAWISSKPAASALFFGIESGTLSGVIDEYQVYKKVFSENEIKSAGAESGISDSEIKIIKPDFSASFDRNINAGFLGKSVAGIIGVRVMYEKGISEDGVIIKEYAYDRKASLYFPDINAVNDQGTISFTFRPEWDGNNGRAHEIINFITAESEINLLKTKENNLELVFKNAGTDKLLIPCQFIKNNFYNLGIVWDLPNKSAGLFINSKSTVFSLENSKGKFSGLKGNLWIGSRTDDAWNGVRGDGLYDELKIFNRVLSDEEMEKINIKQAAVYANITRIRTEDTPFKTAVRWNANLIKNISENIYFYYSASKDLPVPLAESKGQENVVFLKKASALAAGTINFWFNLKDGFIQEGWTGFMEIKLDSVKAVISYEKASGKINVLIAGRDNIVLNSGNTEINPDEWHMLTITRDENICILYIDGTFQSQTRNKAFITQGVDEIIINNSLCHADEFTFMSVKIEKNEIINIINTGMTIRQPEINYNSIEEKIWDLADAHTKKTKTGEEICLHGMWRLTLSEKNNIIPPSGNSGYYSKAPGRWLSSYFYDVFENKNGLLTSVTEVNKKNKLSYWYGWYTRYITIPEKFKNKYLMLVFEYIGAPGARIYVNNKLMETFSYAGDNGAGVREKIPVDISEFNKEKNIKLDVFLYFEKYPLNMHLQGDSLDGIYLKVLDSALAVKDACIKTSTRQKKAFLDIDFYNLTKIKNKELTVQAAFYDSKTGRPVKNTSAFPCRTTGKLIENMQMDFSWEDAVYWDVFNPHLYSMSIDIYSNAKLLDSSFPEKFGFREFWHSNSDYYLNGKPIHLFYDCIARTEAIQRNKYLNCRNESVTNLIRGIKAQGYNMASCDIGWSYNTDKNAIALSPSGIKTVMDTADELGLFMMIHAPMYKEQMDYDIFKKEVINHTRAFFNHPSIIFYCEPGGGLGYPLTMHPAHPAETNYLPDNKTNVWKYAKITENTIRQIDPSRLYFYPYGGHLNETYTTMHYMSFGVPLQEREDWPQKWSETKKCLLFPSEFGFPYDAQFLDFDAPRERNNSKIMLFENAARYFGDNIYRDAGIPARALCENGVARGGITHLRKLLEVKSNTLDPAFFKIKKLFAENHIRAWRGYGVSGHGQFGSDHDAFARNYENYYLENLLDNNIKAPGLRPDKIFVPHRGIYYEQPNELAEVLSNAYSPITAWIGGGKDGFNNKDHAYFADEKIEKQIIICNDLMKDITADAEIFLLKDDKPVESKKGSITVEAGNIKKIPVSFSPRPVATREDFIIALKLYNEKKLIKEDRIKLQVFPKIKYVAPSAVIGLYDPAGKTEIMLKKIGINYKKIKKISELEETASLIIGRECISFSNETFLKELENSVFFKRGMNIIVFEQKIGNYANLLFEEEYQRYVFIKNHRHPVIKSLYPDDFINWKGSSDLMTACPPPGEGMADSLHYPFVKWHLGNTGVVSTFVIKKPVFGDYDCILECGFDLAHTPLIEFKKGNSRIINCQLDVTSRYGHDPVSTILVNNLLDYICSKTPVLYSKTAVFCDDYYNNLFFDKFKIRGERIKKITGLMNFNLLLIASSENAGLQTGKNEIAEYLDKGGTLIYFAAGGEILPVDFFPFSVKQKKEEIFHCFPNTNGTVLAGLGNSDFYFREFKPVRVFDIKNAEELLDNNIIIRKNYGRGSALFIGITPDAFSAKPQVLADKKNHTSFIDKYIHCKSLRILNAILKNNNAEFEMPSFFGNKNYMNNRIKPPGEFIDISSGWKFSYDMEDKGIEKKWGNPDFDDSSWKAITTKTLYEDQGFNSANPNMKYGKDEWGRPGTEQYRPYDGYSWYRVKVKIPPEYQGKKFVLRLGTVIDYDWSYFNGQEIGHTGEESYQPWTILRNYEIPEKLINFNEENILSVRVFDCHGGGGLSRYPVQIEVINKNDLLKEETLYTGDFPLYDVNAHHMW
ncbi:MAG: hypothetical protein A2096_02625 [Spirochaetes bacterium GWF1_41_5]|nr:MAG: hypothetical protein A2096_02625 [Spirochaetes bacterium GWF1_41_5]